MQLVAAIGGLVVAALAAAVGWLARPLPRDPRRRAALENAVAAVDRELAANLELMTMFDQTRQAVILENAEFARHRGTLETEAGHAAAVVAAVYSRIPETEAAMERRGPARTLPEADRALVEAWEGDAREARRSLRQSLDARPPAGLSALTARLRGDRARR